MFLKLIYLFVFVVLIETAYEGERCVKGDVNGVCLNLKKCRTAIQDINNRRNPQVCGFDRTDPIVCCTDGSTGTILQTPQTEPPTTLRPSTYTEDYSSTISDKAADDNVSGCEILPPSLTSKKTGQKAFDKCIEYQEKYIYPCEKGVSLLGDLSRSNNCHHNVDELIIGGKDAAQYEFPHMVLLGYGHKKEQLQWMCGGALISDHFILTAGHCISSPDGGPATYIFIGAYKKSDSSDTSKIYKVKNIIKHPDYKPPSKYNDIALMETEQQMKLDQFTVPACLHTGDDINDEEVLATGWGLTHYKGNTSETLQKVIINKFSTSECAQKYRPARLMKQGFNEETQLCYGDKIVSKDTCQGDSGGPIQIKSKKIQCMYTVVGVTSFGKSCGVVGVPGIYTRVANFVPWIEGIVWPDSFNKYNANYKNY